ncbi:insulinase family protein [Solitalea sp. MAHUQ-68]|uniref:Insulinase family protein n=1 Tax=Solitalea agri TaxID=2953739 RepID=A0A9X2JB77_9SPHI|nr:pitrilysin family protein [Solitalea agri]MCO4291758.1 insulinase family protein [Solitalea agri]
MNKIFLSAAAFLLLCTTTFAQTIDRTHKPAAGPAPAINIGKPQTFVLPNGIKVLVVEDHKLPKVSASLSLDRVPQIEGSKAGVSGLMSAMLNEGTTTRPKAKFDEEVDFIGANVSASAGGGSASALTKYFDKAFGLMADAVLHPAFPSESFDKIKSQAITSLKADEKSAKAISSRVVAALVYGTDHPYGEFETEAKLNGITLDDVKANYKSQFVPNKAYLVFVGDIKLNTAKKLANQYFGSWAKGALDEKPVKTPVNVKTTEIDLVDVPSAVQSEISVTNLVGNTKKNPDYFALIVANQILGGGSNGYLFMNLREKHAYTYGSYSSVGADKYGARFGASASVRNAVTDSAVIQIVNEINRLGNEKATADAIQLVKNTYNGSFAMDLEDKSKIATYALNVETEGLPQDFYQTFLQKINAVSAEDIQRVAKQYFTPGQARIVIVGKASEIAPNLEKLGYKINYFDKYANLVTKTAEAKVAANVNPQTVLDNYIKAIGGNDNVKNIKSLLINTDAAVQGMTLNATIKQMAPNKESMIMSFNGMTVMKSVFDGAAGYNEMQGQKMPLGADDVKKKQEERSIFPEMYYAADKFILAIESTEKVSDKDTYKMKITSPTGNISYKYFDITSGLLLKQEMTVKLPTGQEMSQSSELSDYKPVNGVLMPYTISISAGAQQIDLKVKEVKVNSEVTEADFK